MKFTKVKRKYVVKHMHCMHPTIEFIKIYIIFINKTEVLFSSRCETSKQIPVGNHEIELMSVDNTIQLIERCMAKENSKRTI